MMGIDFLAGTMTLLATWVIGNKSRIGFLIAICSNLLWISYALIHGHTYGVIYECVPLLFINLRNYMKWRSSSLYAGDKWDRLDEFLHKVRYSIFNPWTSYGLNQRCEMCHKKKFILKSAMLYWVCWDNSKCVNDALEQSELDRIEHIKNAIYN